jgi:glucan 1,3-beta-glucosidase
VIGNEALLRGEISEAALGVILRTVKAQVSVPTSYADVWEFWLQHPSLAAFVDVVTVHILPYWEDDPVPAEGAAAHLDAIMQRLGEAFPGKPILVGETGWPSQGRERAGAVPSPADQARVLHDIAALAQRRGYDINYVEAFDQPWKRELEGTVGGYWGLFDADRREPKFEWGEPVSNHPDWPLRAAAGILLALAVVFAAALGARDRPLSRPRHLAVAAAALVPGAALGLAVEMWSLGVRNWAEGIHAVGVLGVFIAASVAAAMGIAGGVGPAPLARVMRRPEPGAGLAWWLGLLLAATAVLALEFAVGLVFDPRYREFPASSLIGPVVALGAALLAGRAEPSSGLAERVFATALVLCGGVVLVQEGVTNREALAFVATIVSLAGILAAAPAVRARAAGGRAPAR